MRIAIVSDHAGFVLKEAVKVFLTAEHRDILDLGTHGTDPVDYSDYAEAIGRAEAEAQVLGTAAARALVLRDRLIAAPKSMAWRVRAVVGDRVRWYDEPEEVR